MHSKAGRAVREDEGQRSFLEHFGELRRRLIACLAAVAAAAAVAFIFYEQVIGFLAAPLQAAGLHTGEKLLYVHTLFEGFLVKLKVSALSGLILASPLLLYQAVRFVFPALSRREKKIVSAALASSFLLVAGSFYYGYYQVIPFSIGFLTGAGFIPREAGLLLNYSKTIFVVFQLLLVAVLLFQAPSPWRSCWP